jgi:siroheme synthase (precorrin-2 oxidase/ferrochelatase)
MSKLVESDIIENINTSVDELIRLQETQVSIVNRLLKNCYDYTKFVEQLAEDLNVHTDSK